MRTNRNVTAIVLGLAVLSFMVTAVAEAEWFQGGTLHHATLAEWKLGSDSNRLATAADWAAALPYVQKKMARESSMNALLPYAYGLVRCLDEAAKVKPAIAKKQKALEAAVFCAVAMEWT